MSGAPTSVGALVQRTWDENVLYSVLVELTYRCNLDCVFCYNDLRRAGRPLSREQYLALLDELAALQVMNLVLSGGEPTTHPDFFAIGARARALGFVVRIKTNGHGLGPSLAERLAREVDPFMLEVSLHGASGVTHDRQTRVPGSFARLMDNLDHAARAGLRVKLNAVLTRWNEHELEAMFALADERGLALQVDPQVTPRDDGDATPTELRASDEGLARYFRLQAERAGPGQAKDPTTAATPEPTPRRVHSHKHCGAGSGGLAIDPFGDVLPCVQWRLPVGNLHETTLTALWRGSRTLDEVRAATVRARTVVEHERDQGLPLVFCPGNALREVGDAASVYPSARHTAEVARRSLATAKLPIVR